MGGSRSSNVTPWRGPNRLAAIARDALRFHWPPDTPPDDSWYMLHSPAEVTVTCRTLGIPLDTSEGTDRAAENAARELQLAGYWARRADITEAVRRRSTPS